jgi:hypothetical protein
MNLRKKQNLFEIRKFIEEKKQGLAYLYQCEPTGGVLRAATVHC